jgi:hypothetical protein
LRAISTAREGQKWPAGPALATPGLFYTFLWESMEIYGNLVTRATKEKYAETKEGLTEVER